MYKAEDYPLVVPEKLTPELIQRLKIGRDYRDLYRLGLTGIVKHTKATEKMPELWWDFDEKTGEWTPYGIQLEIDKYQTAAAEGAAEPGDIPTKVSQLENDAEYQTASEVEEKIAEASSELATKVEKNTNDIVTLKSTVEANKAAADSAIEGHEDRLTSVESKAARNTSDLTDEIQARKDADIDIYAAIRVQGNSIPTKVGQLENDKEYQSKTEVDTRIKEVVGAAPEALDTLEEIARELEEGSTVVSGIINTLATKADKTEVSEGLTAVNNKVDTKVAQLEAADDVNSHAIQSVSDDLARQVSKESADIEGVNTTISSTKSTLEGKIDEVKQLSKEADEAISAEVELKANKAEVDSALEDIDTAVSLKADKAEVEQKVEELSSEIELKAVKTVVDEQIDSLHDELTRIASESAEADDALNARVDVVADAIPTKVGQLENDKGYLTEHQDISGKADKDEIPTKVSELENDKGYLTEHQDISGKADKSEIPTKVSELENDVPYLTEHQDISGKADKSEIPTKVSELENDKGYLTEHQDLSGYSTVTETNRKVNSVTESMLIQVESLRSSDAALQSQINDVKAYKVSSWENDKKYQTDTEVDARIKAIVGAAPEALDTLEEIARELEDKGDAVEALTAEVATKASKDELVTAKSEVEASVASVDEKLDRKVEEINTALDAKASKLELPKKVSDLEQDIPYLTEHQDISGKADKSEIPTKVSELEQDIPYLTEHQDISGKADKSEIPTKVSELENDANYLTEHQDLSEYAKKDELPEIPQNVSAFTNDAGYLTEHQDLSDYVKRSELDAVVTAYDKVIAALGKKIEDLENLVKSYHPTEVASADELRNALNSGEKYLKLTQPISTSSQIRVDHDAEITLNEDITATGRYGLVVANGAKVSLKGTAGIHSTASSSYSIAVGEGAELTIDTTGTIKSDKNIAVSVSQDSKVIINNANVEAQEPCVLAGSKNAEVEINGGTFTSVDNGVVMGNGTAGNSGNHIVINGGTFNGGITSAGYIACGIYVPNDDIVEVNGGTFNITGGCGICARAGQVTVSDGVAINTTGEAVGKVGDSRVVVPCSAVVFDAQAAYPGLTDESKITIAAGANLTSEDSHGTAYQLPEDGNRIVDNR